MIVAIGKDPRYMVLDGRLGKIYVANAGSNDISVINTSNDTKESHDIAVGETPLIW